MFALMVIAHPSEASFSHAMAGVAQLALVSRGYDVVCHDLYAEHFDPVQTVVESGNTTSQDSLVEQHCLELGEADLVLVFHPNWWSQPPAILKGWIDRVFRLDTAYGYAPGQGFDGVPVGLLRARQALIFNTSNTPQTARFRFSATHWTLSGRPVFSAYAESTRSPGACLRPSPAVRPNKDRLGLRRSIPSSRTRPEQLTGLRTMAIVGAQF